MGAGKAAASGLEGGSKRPGGQEAGRTSGRDGSNERPGWREHRRAAPGHLYETSRKMLSATRKPPSASAPTMIAWSVCASIHARTRSRRAWAASGENAA